MGPVVRSNSSNGSVLRAPNLVMTDNVQQSWYVGSIVMSRFVRSRRLQRAIVGAVAALAFCAAALPAKPAKAASVAVEVTAPG